jgi:hypothetical protein
MIKQGSFDTFVQYSEQLRKTYHAHKVTEDPATLIVVSGPDQAMDFFHSLDQGKFGEVKVNIWKRLANEVNETATATIQEVHKFSN